MPEIIVVEDIPSTPPPPVSSRDITSAIRPHSAGTTMTSWTEPETPTRRDDRFEPSDLQVTPTIGGGGSSSRGLRRDRRLSDMSSVSADLGLRHTYVFMLRLLAGSQEYSTDPNWTDASCPCSAIRRTCLRTMIRTCWPQCKIQLGEVSKQRVPRGYSNSWLMLILTAMMLEAEEEEQKQKQ